MSIGIGLSLQNLITNSVILFLKLNFCPGLSTRNIMQNRLRGTLPLNLYNIRSPSFIQLLIRFVLQETHEGKIYNLCFSLAFSFILGGMELSGL